MTRQEFESRINAEVTPEEYKTVERVYMWHPAIPNVGGKDVIAQLWNIGGIALMEDMNRRAAAIEAEDAGYRRRLRAIVEQKKEIMEKVSALEAEIACLNAEFDSLTQETAVVRERIEQLERGN